MRFKRLYKFSVLVLAFVMVLSATSVVASAASWNGEASMAAPSTSEDGFYLISTAEELAWFAQQVNSDAGNAAIKARLINDIYLNDVENDNYSWNWIPIADYSDCKRTYSGTFDGANHTIYGLSISTSNNYQGLFGYLDGAMIKNLRIESSRIAGGSDVGAIAGYSTNSTSITSCIVSATVSGDSNVGGITGYLLSKSSISSSSFSGSVTGKSNRVGGITGCAFSSCTISQTYNAADVYTSGKFAGGICGTNSGSVIMSCYNTGNISADLRVAGIAGNNVGDIYCCYNASMVESISEPAGLTGAIAAFYYTSNINDCYYDSELYTGKEDNAVAMKTDDMKRHTFVSLLNDAGGNFYYDYLIANNGYPILSWQVDQNLWDGTVSKPDLSIDGKYYYISNPRQLAWFAGLVNGTLDGVAQNRSANAILVNSIVLNVGNISSASNVWTPIGSVNNEFDGEFYGNGYTVRGIYIPTGDCVGLFGAVSVSGVVTNLTVAESSVNGGEAVGAVAGVNYGEIERIKVIYADISGENNVGGIVGSNGGSVNNSSSIYSNVSGTDNIGGIVGENYEGSVVETCCSFNDVVGKTNVGGITGENNSDISFSFNAGTVTATDSCAGGIAGRLNGSTISDCYNKGNIAAGSKVGGIAGMLRENGKIELTYSVGTINGDADANAILGLLSNGTVSKSYYDKKKVNVTDSRATGLLTTQMTGSNCLSNMTGFSRQYWITTADTDYHVYYPQLVSFESSGDFDLYDISVESVKYLKDGLVCKVIGTTETSYFKTLKEASQKIGKGVGTIELLANVTINSTVTVEGDVTIIPSDDSIVLLREKYYFDAPFVVKSGATLNFGANDAAYASLNINGNNVNDITNQKFASSFVTVEEGGTLNYYDASAINHKALNGGFVYNCGIVNFYSGSISDGTAVKNGGVAFNEGKINVYATEIKNNNSKLAGGVFYNANGEIDINTSADIHNNTSGEGGAVYIEKGTVSLHGGSVYLNSASYGGAINVAEGGRLKLYDGSVYDNVASVNGSGLYNDGSIEFYAGGNIDASNDIYLPSGKTLTMSSKSVFSASIATITPEAYSEGIKVLSGAYTAMNSNLCVITSQPDVEWHINSGGRLTSTEIKYVLTASFFNSDSVPYTSLAEAMEDIGDNPAIITLIDDITISETVIIKSNISFESDGNPHTISVESGFVGPMFKVVDGAILSLGTSVDEWDTGVLYINGSNVSAETMIEVIDGSLKIYSGTVIFGANEIDSAIKSSTLVEMYGGEITENNVKVGAVNIADGSFNLFAGTIFDNTSVGVFSNGTFTVYEGACVDKSNTVYLADGKVIGVAEQEPVYDEETGEEIDQGIVIPDLVASVDFEKYYVDTSIISGSEEDILKYTDKFSVKDTTYTLDEYNILRSDTFELKEASPLVIGEKWIYGLSVNTYTSKSICLQFTNSNIAVTAKDGRIKGEDEKVGTGDIIVLLDANGDAYRSMPILIYGDVNGDGDVDGNDAVILTLFNYGYFSINQFENVIIEAMDVNHDGVIDEEDASIIENLGVFAGTVNQNP